MRNINNVPIQGTVTLRMRSGNIVVRGSEERETGQLIGSASVIRDEEGTTIQAEGSVVLTLPSSASLNVQGQVDNV
ncbi:MAG TPA: hypothetical protein VF707_02925, partial [Ardenticatenaceae bacterium]